MLRQIEWRLQNGAGFANILPTFFYFMWSTNKVFKDKIFSSVHLSPFIGYQGKNLDLFWIWCCFKFFLHCLVQPNQVIHFLFHILFIIRIGLWIFQMSICTLYASEILLLNVFINAGKLTGEMQIDWSFFLGVWHSSLSVSVTDWTLSWPSIQWVCL